MLLLILTQHKAARWGGGDQSKDLEGWLCPCSRQGGDSPLTPLMAGR